MISQPKIHSSGDLTWGFEEESNLLKSFRSWEWDKKRVAEWLIANNFDGLYIFDILSQLK